MDRLSTRFATAIGFFLALASVATAQLPTSPPVAPATKTPAAPAAAATPAVAATPAAPAVEAPSEALIEQLGSPRATLKTLIDGVNHGDNRAASKALDLSEVGEGELDSQGSSLAYKLKSVIDRIAFIDFDVVPDRKQVEARDRRAGGDETKRLTSYSIADYLAKANASDVSELLDAKKDAGLLVMKPDESGLWRFDKTTVEQIPDLYERWKDANSLVDVQDKDIHVPVSVRLERLFPGFGGTHFLIPDYQWICLIVLIFMGFAADLVTRLVLSAATRTWFRYVRARVDYRESVGLWKPIGLLMQALVWLWGTRAIGLPPAVSKVLSIGVQIFGVVVAVWTAFLLVDLLGAYLQKKAQRTSSRFDDLLVPLLTKSVKAVAVCVGVLEFADVFNLQITGLLGGLGLGGAALALASKDALGNFFGSVTVLADRPFEIGDWVIVSGVEGSVETVGIRSTRIRTFYNSLITVPNSQLTTAIVDNMGRRRFRRIKTTLGVQYDTTPEQIEAFCEGIRELIRRHPYTRKDYYQVYFNNFGDSALEILLICFVECPDYSIELRERERLLLNVMRLADRLGVSFAFPTRTVHMYQEQPSDVAPSFDSEAPLDAGRNLGSEIAGELQHGTNRPGPVKF